MASVVYAPAAFEDLQQLAAFRADESTEELRRVVTLITGAIAMLADHYIVVEHAAIAPWIDARICYETERNQRGLWRIRRANREAVSGI